jgi:hypothetical protein
MQTQTSTSERSPASPCEPAISRPEQCGHFAHLLHERQRNAGQLDTIRCVFNTVVYSPRSGTLRSTNERTEAEVVVVPHDSPFVWPRGKPGKPCFIPVLDL